MGAGTRGEARASQKGLARRVSKGGGRRRMKGQGMVRKSVPTGRRALGSALGAVGLGALLVATAAGCASSAKSTGASGSSSVQVVTTSASAGSPSASASTSASPSSAAGSAPAEGGATTSTGASNHPIIPSSGGIVTTPKAQLSAVPAGAKLVAFDSASRSKDGMTLYLGIESQGGACGQYDVVLQQNGGTVRAGLVHLPATSRVCPMYMGHLLVAAKLSAPLSGGSVVDLANNQVVQAPEQS